MIQTLSRRSLLSAAGPAAAVVAIPALGGSVSASDDAELRRLWDKWLKAKASVEELLEKQAHGRRLVAQETKHLRCDHLFHDVAMAHPRAKRRWTAVEKYRGIDRGPALRWRPIPGTMSRDQAFDFGERRIAEELAVYRAARTVARARHGLDALDVSEQTARDRRKAVEDAIRIAPAEGVFGIAVKIAVSPYKINGPDGEECIEVSALRDATTITGVDFEGLMKWRSPA